MTLLLGCETRGGDAALEEQGTSEPRLAAQVASGGTCTGGAASVPARGLSIREVALYQTVKIPLYRGNAWVAERNATVVQGKRALVRVFVDAVAGYGPHAVRGVLTLQNRGVATELVSERRLLASSTDEGVDSTFSFDVPAAAITADTQLAVSLTECGAEGAAAQGTRVPPLGLTALRATEVGVLKLVLVPVALGGRAPTYTQRDLDSLRDALMAMYPVPDVQLSVRTPLNWTGTATPRSYSDWTNILTAVRRTRAEDRAPADTYYFGVIQPAGGASGFTGMSPLNTSVAPAYQAGLSTFFPTAGEYGGEETVAHELGHLHGRPHAPCGGAGNPDPRYPHAGGLIGSWGWDARRNKLIPPSASDVMGYCRQRWISDYNYQGIAARSRVVNKGATSVRALVLPPPDAPQWEELIAYADGTNRWSGIAEQGLPAGRGEPAQALDAAGNVVAEVEVFRTAVAHVADQYILMPRPQRSWSKVLLRDREIALADVASPR